ncbi:MAG: GGDEF domain-containing protein [Minwuiales bacterium]|nr:GGDEF domain-containing protein [Minwuiales bacterium]
MAPPIAATDLLAPNPALYTADMVDRVMRRLDGRSPAIDAEQRAVIEELLAYAANAEQQIAVQQARISYLESLSMTDELTGLANRRGFEQALQRILSSARRYGETGVVAFIDLDRFKHINDTLGHEAGDLVLRHVAALLADNIRMTDTVARLGGDEFVVLLTRTDAENGRKRAATLQRLLNQSQLSYQGRDIQIQASFGVQAYDGATDMADLLRRADRAMYRNKRRSNVTPLNR